MKPRNRVFPDQAASKILPTQPMTQSDLLPITCKQPGCNCLDEFLVFASGCHKSPVIVRYVRARGELQLICCACHALTATFQIAKEAAR